MQAVAPSSKRALPACSVASQAQLQPPPLRGTRRLGIRSPITHPPLPPPGQQSYLRQALQEDQRLLAGQLRLRRRLARPRVIWPRQQPACHQVDHRKDDAGRGLAVAHRRACGAWMRRGGSAPRQAWQAGFTSHSPTLPGTGLPCNAGGAAHDLYPHTKFGDQNPPPQPSYSRARSSLPSTDPPLAAPVMSMTSVDKKCLRWSGERTSAEGSATASAGNRHGSSS